MWVAAAAPAPFSHRLHLQMKLECAACHPAALTSTSKADRLLPKREACLGCHKAAAVDPTLQKPREEVRIARFNHQLHLKLGDVGPVIAAAIDRKQYLSAPGAIRSQLNSGNACVACHRNVDKSDKINHDLFPRMADCLVCHNQIDLPFSCEFCHGKGQQLKPVDHPADFLDTHTSGKLKLDKSTCAVCHGRRFTCLGCH